MKSVYVADLVANQALTEFFLVFEKEVRTGKSSGKPYLRLALGDRTGVVEARMWEDFERVAEEVARNDFVKVQGRVEEFNGRKQVKVDRIRRAKDGEVRAQDFLPHTEEDIDQLWARLREHAAGIGNPWLRRLLDGYLDDASIAPRLKRAPAAKGMHHAYIGGLLEHVVSLCGLCRIVAGHYPEVDADLLLAGAVLHDLGKLDELSYERGFDYTTEGQLLGHIVMQYEEMSRRIDAIEGFPAELKLLLQHMLISHHGKLEFGSPRPPMFREAVLLHYLDDLDSKMAAMRRTLALDTGEGEWSEWNAALARRLLRTDRLGKEPKRGEPAGQQELPLAPAEEK